VRVAVAVIAVVGLAACTDSAPSAARNDAAAAASPDASYDACSAAPIDLRVPDGESPDLACRGAAVDGGAPGTLADHDIDLIVYGAPAERIAGATIDVFYANRIGTVPDVTVACDAEGRARVPLPVGVRVAVHVRGGESTADSYTFDDLHVIDPATARVRWFGMTRERLATVALAMSGDRDVGIAMGTGLVVGTVVDCRRRPIAGAEVSLAVGAADVAFGRCGDGPCRAYFSDAGLPEVGRRVTSKSGAFAMLGVPSIDGVSISARGIDCSRAKIGTRAVDVRDGAVTFLFVEPYAAE